MGLLNKSIIVIFLLFFYQSAQAFAGGYAHFIPRSQTNNTARLILENSLTDTVMEKNHTWITPEYTHSFRSNHLARYLFGCNCGWMTFSGSKVANRKKTDILADYFCLPTDFQSTVRFCPVIQNFMLDCGATFTLDCIHEGMYCSLQIPLVHTSWNLRMNEWVQQKGVSESLAGYLSGGNQPLNRGQLASNVTTAFQGGVTCGDMQDPLRYGKICGKQTATEIAEVRAQVGWRFCKRYEWDGDVNIFISAPTGTRTTGEYLFEPIVGNNHHWEIGIGAHGARRLWTNCNGEHQLWGYLRANLSHLCASQQRRSFDLKNGRGSRYMLLAGMDTLRDDILEIPAGSRPQYQYTSHLYPAINKTTLNCRISRAVQADFSIGLVYKHDCWEVNGGYDLWLMSHEKLSCRARFADNKFVLKGDAQMYGFADLSGLVGIGSAQFVPVPLSVSQHAATLYGGQGTGNATLENNNSDNPQDAFQNISTEALLAQFVAGVNVFGSSPIIFLTDNDIDECSALAPRASSSTLFLSCQRIFEMNKQCDAFLGAGLELELGHSFRALTQWGIWLRAGISY
jgi:hypothetical protein